MRRLRTAVIGAGHLGRIHTRLAVGRDDIEFLGVVEPNDAVRARITTEFQTPGYAQLAAIIDHLDAALVITPTQHHHEVARPLLERGISCFIEKPITFSLAEADDLIALARARGAVLQVGHVERFNPALRAARGGVAAPRYLEGTRTSTYTFRSIDIGVVLDLMIHDIDIALDLAGSAVTDVRAWGATVFGPHEDIAQARLEFANGCAAQLMASRVHPAAQRTLAMYGDDGFALLDLGARTAKVVRRGAALARGELDVLRAAPAEVAAIKERLFTDYLPLEEPAIAEANPIADEQSDFFAAIRERREPIVTGEQGRAALEVAYRVLDALRAAPAVVRSPHFHPGEITRKAG